MNPEGSQGKIIRIDEVLVKQELGEVVRGTVEETLNKLLDAEADELCKVSRYERTPDRIDTRAGYYERGLETKAGKVKLKVPKLRTIPFESACGNAGSARLGESPADQIPVMAIDDGNQMAPAIALGEQVRHIDRPAGVGRGHAASHALNARALPIGPLPALPAAVFHDPMDAFAVDRRAMLPPKDCGDATCPVFRFRVDDGSNLLLEPFIFRTWLFPPRLGRVVEIRSVVL
jgi:hypothetical protein